MRGDFMRVETLVFVSSVLVMGLAANFVEIQSSTNLSQQTQYNAARAAQVEVPPLPQPRPGRPRR
jgi:hypothetical protein